MDDHFLVATHISSLSSTPPSTIVVEPARQNAALSTTIQDNDLPIDHASYSSAITTSTTGTVLLRVIHGGLIIELTSLSTPVPPLRIVFPAAVLPTPSIFLWDESELRLIAVTESGSLYRISIPVEGPKLWQEQAAEIWPREYFIRNFPVENPRECAVHVQATHCVVMSMHNGVLLRLEADADTVTYNGNDAWTESVFHHGSFLSSLSSFFPMHSGNPNASAIISVASHPWPTDILNTWTLSRDRTLRLWKAKLGCVASKTLPATPNSRDLLGSTSPSGKHLLLDAEQQNLVKIFSLTSSDEERIEIYALAFIPTQSSTSGGFFCLLDTSSDQFVEIGIIECPKQTAHCHLQDFTINGNTLYTLWDRQGQSMVERTEIDLSLLKEHDLNPPVWRTSYYTQEPELTPAYMEEQLLSSGSLAEKFLNAIMKPGVFSSLTLRTALDKYIDSCSSIPGPVPSQLGNTYSTLCENIAAVVGCTVTLNRDPHTGGFQHANYWTALKRDWEGFVARCREIERSARWPLSIVIQGSNGILVIERERVGSLVIEDVPIRLRRTLERDQKPHPQHVLFAILWRLRWRLGPRLLSSLENRVVDMMHQEIAFSFAEILQDQAHRMKFTDILDADELEALKDQMEDIEDMDAATRVALDCVGAFDLSMKHEDMDVELLGLPTSSDWLRSQAAAYTATTVEARYDLCLCLIISLFFQAEDLQAWDGSLLAEVFAVFRGLGMLRFVASQPAETRPAHGPAGSTSDDVIAQMRSMNVSNSKLQAASKSSLIQLLIAQSPASDGIATIAHNFLDATGILQSISPAHATKQEILFCDRVRLLGFFDVTRELLSWLPRTPAATFLQSQAMLKLGRMDDAAQLLEKLSGCFGISNLTLEDSQALASVLPNAHPMDSQYSFYLYAADLFHNSYVGHEVNFSQLAIQVAPPGAETAPIWNTVIKGLTDLALYEEAYASVMTMPFEKQKRECASQLAIRMSEENAVEKLMTFDFAGIASEVESALSFKARNADPRLRPCYSRILYTWHTRRGDHRNASLTMYQRARKLQDVITDAASFVSLAEDQLEALSVAINALNLVDEKNAWILMPMASDPARKHPKLSKHIPESKYLSSKHDAEIIHLADMQYDCTLLRAQVDSIKREPSILSSPEYLLPPSVIVMRLAQSSQYSQAMAAARSLKIDMIDIFIHLTNQCIRLSRNPGSVLEEDTSGWLLTDNATSWQGTPSDRGWRYLRQSLKRHDGPENDYRYAKASLETILSTSSSLSSPPWLIDILEKYQPEYLIRVSLRYDNIADAVNYTYALVLKSDKQFARESTKEASITWLPYALIDQVLIAADALMDPPQNLSQLRTTINNRVKRMQKSSQNVS